MLALARAQVAAPRVLLAEQNMAQAVAVADCGYVLENGQIVLEGTAAELLASPAVRKACLGGE